MSETIRVWFYDANAVRVAKEDIEHPLIVAHQDLIQLDGEIYRFMGAHPGHMGTDIHYCIQIEPLVIRDVVEGL